MGHCLRAVMGIGAQRKARRWLCTTDSSGLPPVFWRLHAGWVRAAAGAVMGVGARRKAGKRLRAASSSGLGLSARGGHQAHGCLRFYSRLHSAWVGAAMLTLLTSSHGHYSATQGWKTAARSQQLRARAVGARRTPSTWLPSVFSPPSRWLGQRSCWDTAYKQQWALQRDARLGDGCAQPAAQG